MNEAIDCFGWDGDVQKWLMSYDAGVHIFLKDIKYDEAVTVGFNAWLSTFSVEPEYAAGAKRVTIAFFH